ncbi:MAG: DUF58 domain-containing protein [Polyangiaceae bacterium]
MSAVARRPLTLRRVNLARLNHILIPTKKPDRDRLRKSLGFKLVRPGFWFVTALSREGRAFTVGALLIGAAGLDVTDADVYLLFAGMVGMLFAAFLLRPFYRLRACQIEVDCPPRVSAGSKQTFTISVHNAGEQDLTSLRVERPFLPWDGKWLGAPLGIARIGPGATVNVHTEATFVERGEHHLDAFELAALVPLGLAVSQSLPSGACRFLVVPKIANVVSLDLAAPSASASRTRRVPHRAQGEDEMAGVRPYRFGDPLKLLHVRTWARTGVPHVRQFVEERSEGVALVVALDGTDAPEDQIEAAISLAAGVAALLVRTSGIEHLVIANEVTRVAPARGRAALDLVLDRLANIRPTPPALDAERALRDIAGTVTTAVVVTADDAPARASLIEAIRRLDVPARWVEVVADPSRRSPAQPRLAPGRKTVEVSRITRSEAIAC